MSVPIPKVGDEIYVDDLEFEDVWGGLATVSMVEKNGGVNFISIQEVGGVSWSWDDHLDGLQDQLREQFGSERASG